MNKKEKEDADNHYNCPIVTSYSEVIRTNMDILKEKDVKFMNPFLALDDKEKLKKTFEEFKTFNITKNEIENAVEKAFKEQENFKSDIRKKEKKF